MARNSNLNAAIKTLPKNLSYDAVKLGRRAFTWALEECSRSGLRCNFSKMRVLIRKQCSMIYVKRIALAIIDDCEESAVALQDLLKERKIS